MPNKVLNKQKILHLKKQKISKMFQAVQSANLNEITNKQKITLHKKLSKQKISLKISLVTLKNWWLKQKMRVKIFSTKPNNLLLKLSMKYQDLRKVPKEKPKMLLQMWHLMLQEFTHRKQDKIQTSLNVLWTKQQTSLKIILSTRQTMQKTL